MKLKIGYAANHKIGADALRLMLSNDITPLLLFLPEDGDCNDEIITMLPNTAHIIGREFKSIDNIDHIRSLELDYILSVHFPYIIPKEIIRLPKVGVLNIHPAYLPYNKGWHTTCWSIYESTPFGVTLHWVDEGVDTGDIALQKPIAVSWTDTADSLYKKAIQCELELLKEAIPYILNRNLPRVPQPHVGTFHFKKDIEKIRRIDLDLEYRAKEFINLLRALTTNNWNEAAFFEANGKKNLISVEIKECDK